MSDHKTETDATLREVRTLAERARGNSRFYAYTGGAATAFAALADDLEALAVAMADPRVGPPIGVGCVS